MTPIEYLYSLELHGVKLGLDNIKRLLREAGDPQNDYPSVHVGGTNGKGSVIAILDAILCAAGYKTGRFTSPHLIDIRERFLVRRSMIRRNALESHIRFFRKIAESMEQPPTFFELNTAIAFRHFAMESVDVALIEVGMGGRFDSTNVLRPEATCITNIGLEHTAYLGDTIEKIAFEKAGILKERVPLVLARTEPAARDVILARARELSCPVFEEDSEYHYELIGDPLEHSVNHRTERSELKNARLALPGAYQGGNAAAAITLARILSSRFPAVSDEAVREGLRSARWPCRLETVLQDPPVIIDVAHNASAAAELVNAVKGPCVVVLAVSSDKNAREMVRILGAIADPLIVTQFANRRALPLADLCACVADRPHVPVAMLPEALDRALALASESKPLVITGSLFTAGEARKVLMERYGAPPLRF